MGEEAGFPEPRVFDMTLVTSEAAANAVEHAPVKGHVEVRTLLYPDRLEIQVEGAGEFQTPDRLKERHNRGLGLPLMAKLSDHLALYSGPQGGTLVSLIFYRPGMERKSEARLPPSIRELIEENELVSAITEKAPVGLFLLDPQMRFRWSNGAYRSFLEEPYRSGDVSGLYIGDVVPGSEEMGARRHPARCLPEWEARLPARVRVRRVRARHHLLALGGPAPGAAGPSAIRRARGHLGDHR